MDFQVTFSQLKDFVGTACRGILVMRSFFSRNDMQTLVDYLDGEQKKNCQNVKRLFMKFVTAPCVKVSPPAQCGNSVQQFSAC